VRSSRPDVSSTLAVDVTVAKTLAILCFQREVERDKPMQRRRRGRYETEQVNLFHPKRVRPAWEALPVEARREVTKLVARMLSAYKARHAAADAEVQDD